MKKAVGMKKGLRYFVLAIVLTIAAMGLPLQAYAEDPTLPEPEHTKSAVDNGDGTYKVSLDVKGKSSSDTKKTSANVIVVLDVSGSMDKAVSQNYQLVGTTDSYTPSYDDRTQYYGYDEQSQQYFAINYYNRYGWYSNYYPSYTGNVYTQKNTSRLDIAKNALYNLSTQLIGDADSTVKMTLLTFSGDVNNGGTYKGGESPSFNTTVKNLTADGGTWWAGALQQAVNIANQDTTTPTYIVFISDGVPTYGIDSNGNRTGDGYESHALQSYFKSAVNIANSRNSNVGIFTIYTGSSAATRMGQFASQTNSGRSAYDGTDESGLNSAFSDLVKTVETAISYTNVTITDTLNNQYFEFADKPEITCTKTVGGQKTTLTDQDYSYDASTGVVTWNLGNTKLDNNATYTISFNIKAKQAAYDEAASNKRNGGTTTFETNSSGTLDYSTIVSVNGTAGDPTVQPQATYSVPSVEIPTSTITVNKTWTGTANIPDSLTINVADDKKVLDANGTMNADGSWTYTAIVAAGPEGHTYTVTEDTSDGWTSNYPDGQTVTLTGLTSQSATVDFTNTLKTYSFTIVKKVGGNFGDTSHSFKFTLSLTDSAGNAMTGVAAGSGSTGTISGGSNGVYTVSLADKQSVTVTVPYGTKYTVTEDNPNVENQTPYTTTIAIEGSGTDNSATTARQASSDGITSDTTVTYTNSKTVTPDVAVDLGSPVPYLIAGLGAAAAAVYVAARRRHADER